MISGTPKASIIRVFDALLGGKDNYDTDRAVRDRLLDIDPMIPAAAWDMRKFVARVVRYLAGHAGVSQFVDCGPVLPIGENTHEIASRLNPEATVIYVSTDPLVLAYSRALQADNDRTHVAEVNITRPSRLFADPVVRKHLDLSQPVALLHVGTLHHFPDQFDPWAAVAECVSEFAPGSYVALAHAMDPGPSSPLSDVASAVHDLYATKVAGGGAWFRSMDQISAMLPSLSLLEPGLVPIACWWPDGPRTRPLGATQSLFVGGVAVKN